MSELLAGWLFMSISLFIFSFGKAIYGSDASLMFAMGVMFVVSIKVLFDGILNVREKLKEEQRNKISLT